MADISIDKLAEQFEGRKFGELVLHHLDNQSFEQIVASMDGTREMLPLQVREGVVELIDRVNSLAREKEFWNNDCGTTFRFIISMTDKELQKKEIYLSEENLFYVFNIIVMNFAYSSHKDPRMRKFIKSSIKKKACFREYSDDK